MDHTTTEVRLASWRTVIEQCQQRPEGMTIKQWLQDNNIKRDQYFYYQRRLRQAAFAEAEARGSHLPAVRQASEVAFAELPSETVSAACASASETLEDNPLTVDTGFRPDAVVRTDAGTIEFSNTVSEPLLRNLLEVMCHA